MAIDDEETQAHIREEPKYTHFLIYSTVTVAQSQILNN